VKNSRKGSQIPLYTDADVRRDNLASKQWVEQHMRIKVHLTGFACAYEHIGGAHTRDPDLPPKPGRDQGSYYSQCKHKVADAAEYLRLNAEHKPRIFVATTPNFLPLDKEGSYISKLTNNLRESYGMNQYLWVREYTKKGFPHFHFVADMPECDPVKLSLSWSRYFGSDAKNSIRFGTKPDAKGRRNFWIKNQRMCWYLTKYLGKTIGEFEKIEGVRRPRAFAISQALAKASQPVVYHSYLSENWNGFRDRHFELTMEDIEAYVDVHGVLPPTRLNPRNFSWRWTGHGQTHIGFLKREHSATIEKS
jgi:hypothetical protein